MVALKQRREVKYIFPFFFQWKMHVLSSSLSIKNEKMNNFVLQVKHLKFGLCSIEHMNYESMWLVSLH